MRVTLVPSATNPHDPHQFLTSFLINDTVAIDAGSIGFYRPPTEQARVKHVFLSHTHIDHIAALPIFVENAYEGHADCVTIYGTKPVLDCLQRDVFNDRLWPDFVALSSPKTPFMKLSELHLGRPIEVDGLRLTPLPVNHVVPTTGFIIEDATGAVIVPGDTGPTEEIWQAANKVANVKAVFLEVTFPDDMAWLADLAKHHTPRTFALELRKLHHPATPIAVHIKPRFRAQVVKELEALGLSNLIVGQGGQPYEF